MMIKHPTKIDVTRLLYYNLALTIYGIFAAILRPLGRARRAQVLQNAHIDPYGAWFMGNLFRDNASLFGTYEMEVKAFMRKTLPKGGTFLDIGSAIGLHLPYACRLVGKTGQVVALEPDPRNVADLRKLKANKGFEYWIIEGALWHEAGSMTLNLDPTGYSYVSALKYVKQSIMGPISKNNYEVNTLRLDALVQLAKPKYYWVTGKGGPYVDLVKIDIEGSEYLTLSDTTLDLSAIKNMVLELHYRLSSPEYERIRANLEAKGLKIIDITRHTKVIQGFYSHHIFLTRESPY